MRAQPWCLAAIVAGGVLLTGCRAAQTAEAGIRIGDETLNQFEAGQTTRQWLVAVLGEPTSRSAVEGLPDTHVYRYVLQERGGLLSAFTGGGERNTAVVYFILTENVVTRFWADRAVERNALGQAVEQTGGEKAMP